MMRAGQLMRSRTQWSESMRGAGEGPKTPHTVATLFPNIDSFMRLVSALLAEQDEEWLTAKIYLQMTQ
jgi:hypothetical protein